MGDFNVALDSNEPAGLCVKKFLSDCSLSRCDELFYSSPLPTYINEALDQQSLIDYMCVSCTQRVRQFEVLDLHVNFSDHRPILGAFLCHLSCSKIASKKPVETSVSHLRWDHADLTLYYDLTRRSLEPVLLQLQQLESSWHSCSNDDVSTSLESVLDAVIRSLDSCAVVCVPKVKKIFFKNLVECRIRSTERGVY